LLSEATFDVIPDAEDIGLVSIDQSHAKLNGRCACATVCHEFQETAP